MLGDPTLSKPIENMLRKDKCWYKQFKYWHNQ